MLATNQRRLTQVPATLATDAKLVNWWLVERWLIRVRWWAPPICFLLVPLFPATPAAVLILAAIFTLATNVALTLMLHRDPGAEDLRRARLLATVADWALGFTMVWLFAYDAASAAPAILLLLVMTSGARYGMRGLMWGAVMAAAGITVLKGAQFVSGGDISDAARQGLVSWILFVLVTVLVARGLTSASNQWRVWLNAQFDHEDAELRRIQFGLSAREWEVLPLLVRSDLTYDDIAAQLHITSDTVKTHVRNIGAKFEVTGRQQVIAAARQRGLVSPATDPVSDPLTAA